ncbi:MAG: DUF488 domain-containing protein [Bacteroidetes bacterium]|nr:DUF488 domain-containing protein [Bacteroidota bacterium]
MKSSSIYTIGYGNRKIEVFLDLLKQNEIEYLVDVRSHPFSRFNPAYRKAQFTEHLKLAGIKYGFMGKELGGKPKDESLYNGEELDYKRVKQSPDFINGIDRLKDAINQNLRLAVMCAELDPLNCHRYSLIGIVLANEGIEVVHIGKDGTCINHKDLK